MYKTELEYLKKNIEEILLPGANIKYCGQISNELSVHSAYDERGNWHVLHDDWDYEPGSILSIEVGPFNAMKETEMNACLDRIQNMLQRLGYILQETPFGRIENGQATWRIRFKRGKDARLHV